MFIRACTIGVTALLLAVPAAAQERGTIELGGFANYSFYDDALGLDDGWGGGGRIGAFLFPHLSVEFDIARKGADRPNGLQSVSVEAFSARLTAVPLIVGPVSFLVGAGAVHTDYEVGVDDGFQGLVGMKWALGSSAALRVEGLLDRNSMDGDETWNKAIQFGLSFYRHPKTRTVTVQAAAPPPEVRMMAPQDSVSAAETRRLRAAEASLRALRDSIRNAPIRPAPMTAAEIAAMQSHIHFDFDRSELTDSARTVLDQKLTVFRANPEMAISIVGHTDNAGSTTYNQALGTRRAEAAKAYLVSRGIAADRIVIQSMGETQPVTGAVGRAAQAPNRRAVFQIVIVPSGR